MSITLEPDQKRLIDGVRTSMQSGNRWVLMQAATGAGKCLGINTPVLMYDGSIEKVQDIVAGQLLMGPDSTPRRVVSTCVGKEELFRITPTKGEPWVCNKSHILSLKRTAATESTGCAGYESRSKLKGHQVNIPISEYLLKSKTFKHIYKQWRTAVNFSPRKKLPVSPYFLGIWLGDGTARHPHITTMDKEIVYAVRDEAKRFKLKIRIDAAGGKSKTYRLSSGATNKQNPLSRELRCMGLLSNKHIPLIYKTASRKDRLQLLAGLMDTDGSLSRGGYDYISKIKRLSEDVAYIARSLGLAAYINECEKKCYNNGVINTYWRVSISGDTLNVPCRIPHKKSHKRLQKKDVNVTGFTVESIGVGDYYGFEISGNDRLFLLGDFTVTHNTYMGADIIKGTQAKGTRCMITVPRKELLRQTALALREFDIPFSYIAGGHETNPMAKTFLATTQTLADRINEGRAPDVDLIMPDETHFGGNELNGIITHYKSRGARGIGMSATPLLMSGKGMDCWYDDMVQGESIKWLIDRGRLSGYKIFDPDRSDLIRSTKGKRQLVGDEVSHYKQHAMGLLAIAYCKSIAHSKQMADRFNAAGIPAANIDGYMSDDARRKIIMAYARREILVLCNNMLLTFGFDLKSASGMDVNIEVMIDSADTESLAQQMQKWGRVLRKKQFPALIFDHAGNRYTHGYPDDHREWSLRGIDKSKEFTGGGISVKNCNGGTENRDGTGSDMPPCYFSHRPAPRCPNCGCFYKVDAHMIQTIAGELTESAKPPRRAFTDDEIKRRQEDIDTLTRNGIKKGIPSYLAKKWAIKKASIELEEKIDREASGLQVGLHMADSEVSLGT